MCQSCGDELPPIWSQIFQAGSAWLNEMKELQEIKQSILPTLVGPDFNVCKNKETYFVMLLHDWSGELKYAQQALYNSFHSFRVTKDNEIYIIGSRITLNIEECMGRTLESGRVAVASPNKVFKRKGASLYTSVLYHGDTTIYEVGPNDIGGIRGRMSLGIGAVRDICSIKMKSGDGRTVYRVLVRHNMRLPLRGIVTTDETERQWVTSWKIVKAGWRE